jgi:hypothetical protein
LRICVTLLLGRKNKRNKYAFIKVFWFLSPIWG